jgi:hypothetical protein
MNCKSISDLKSIVKYNNNGDPLVEGIISITPEEMIQDSDLDPFEGWNNVLCTKLVGEDFQLYLVDIGWKMVGCNPDKNLILFEVCATVDLDCFTQDEFDEWNA